VYFLSFLEKQEQIYCLAARKIAPSANLDVMPLLDTCPARWYVEAIWAFRVLGGVPYCIFQFVFTFHVRLDTEATAYKKTQEYRA
jgi:hypothetical protein